MSMKVHNFMLIVKLFFFVVSKFPQKQVIKKKRFYFCFLPYIFQGNFLTKDLT